MCKKAELKLWISGRGTLAMQERLRDASLNVLECLSQTHPSISGRTQPPATVQASNRATGPILSFTRALDAAVSQFLNETLLGKTVNTVSFHLLSLLFFLKDGQTLHILKVMEYFDMWYFYGGDEREEPTGGSQSAPQGCFHCWSYFGPSPDLVPHRCPCVTRASLHPDSEFGSEDILHPTAVHHWPSR